MRILVFVFAAKRLLQRRVALGIGQEQLAHRSGVSFPTIQKLEQGKAVNPELETLERLAAALGCEVCDLLGENRFAADTGTLTSSIDSRRRGPRVGNAGLKDLRAS